MPRPSPDRSRPTASQLATCDLRSSIATAATHFQPQLRSASESSSSRTRDIGAGKRFVQCLCFCVSPAPNLHCIARIAIPTPHWPGKQSRVPQASRLKTLQTDPPSTSTVQQASRRHDNTVSQHHRITSASSALLDIRPIGRYRDGQSCILRHKHRQLAGYHTAAC